MPAYIRYDGNTYIDVEFDANDTLARLGTILNSDRGTGILIVTTASGPVHLLVSPSIPISITEDDAPGTKKRVARHIR